MSFLLSYDYDEIDLIREIINLKIIDINEVFEKYKNLNVKNKNYTFEKLNFLLEKSKLPKIEKNKNYYIYDENISEIKLENIFVYKDTIRQNMILLTLFLTKKTFNIRKFLQKIEKNEENRRHIQKDLRKVLEKFDIDYLEYMNSENGYQFLKSKIDNFEKIKSELLLDTFIRKWEIVYKNREIIQEKKLFEIVEEELNIKNLIMLYEEYKKMIVKIGKIYSKKVEYELFIELILNLKNKNVNTYKRVAPNTLKLKSNTHFKIIEEMLNNFSKIEKIEISRYFKIKFYKYLLKSIKYDEKNEKYGIKEIFNKKNYNLEIEKNKINQLEVAENLEVDNYNLQFPKIKTLLVFDMEKYDIEENFEYIEKLLEKLQIENIIEFEEFNNNFENNKKIEKIKYEQILVISKIKIQNVIQNKSKLPLFIFEIEGGTKRNKKLKNNKKIKKLYTMMIDYIKINNNK